MTVDESQMSAATTASTAAPGTPKSKASIVNTPSSKSPLPAQGQFQQPEAVSSPRSTQAPMDHGSFDAYAQANPAKADELIAKLIEVTGTTDRGILIRALEQSKKTDQNHEFNVTCAIEWILSMSERQSNDHQRPRRKPPGQSQFASPGGANATNNHSFAPMQPPNSPSSTAAVASGENAELRSATNMPLVDLTDSSNDVNNKDDGDADLEKAIALSLQEHKRNDGPNFGVSQEDQDVSRALEASLMETQSSKRSRGMIDYVDPLNPHDRQRKEMWPVGLKNVGQTCWFSAVIQSLFYLPAFRSLVLNYPPPQNREVEKLQEFGNDRRRKIVEFMLELRKLFALMVGTQRKYVDPSRAVDILRGSIGTLNNQQNKDILTLETNNQQDVSEFTHIVLEWVEEAFKEDLAQGKSEGDVMQMDADCEKENNEEKEVVTKKDVNDADNNPMSRLFYGKVLTEGRIRGDDFVRQEAFGQWPLQVNTFANIHESLENSLAHESLDPDLQEAQHKSGQERWFLRLPPVLFLELSRFHYNMERKTAEKIHNRLEFPERIFMDRYVADNKVVTRQKREEVRALKEKRAQLGSRLDKFTSYGQSPMTSMTLPTILQKTLDFAKASSIPPTVASLAVSNLMQVDSPCGSPKMTPAPSLSNLAAAATAPNNPLNDCDEEMDVEMADSSKEAAGCDSDAINNSLVESNGTKEAMEPHPRFVSDAELRVLQDCLCRWKSEVEQDMQELQTAIETIEKQIENMYCDESLKRHEYQLHAVMVHEGSVDSGHYWAYVLDHKRKVWLKFNDNTVNEASWNELAKESMGGHSNTSAYSLVYIDTSKPEILMDAEWASSIGGSKEERMDQGELEALAVTLPNDLAQYVVDDNNLFQDEIVQWDRDQLAQNSSPVKPTTDVLDMEQSLTAQSASEPNDVQVVEEKLTYVNNHAKLSMEMTINAVQRVENIIKDKGPQTAVLTALERIIDQYCATHQQKYTEEIKDSKPGSQAPPKTELLPGKDYKLESFVYYLLRNDETNNMPLVELAVLEQFSFPGLEMNSATMSSFRAAADVILTQRRAKHPHEAAALRHWHQAYHLFRRSVHCFIHGLKSHMENKHSQALDLYTEAFNYTTKAAAVPVSGGSRTLKETLVVRYMCKVLPEVNRTLISQLKYGDNLKEVINGVQTFIVPVLVILQNRVDHQQRNQNGYNGLDAQTLEEVRNDWCALVGDAEMSSEASTFVSEIIPIVLLDTPVGPVSAGASKNSVNQTDELNLANHYATVVEQYLKFGAPRQLPSQNATVTRAEP